MDIKRILIAIDASPHSLAALETAADLADKLRVELRGLYIEDENLLRFAQLPFAREFRFSRTGSQKIDAKQMAEQVRLQSTLAERHFNDQATNRNLKHSFHVGRGAIATELKKEAEETDLLVLGRISRSLLQTTRLGSTAKTVLFAGQQSLLLTHTSADFSQPILLIYDGTESSEKALAMSFLVSGENGRYNILINTEDDQQAKDIKKHLDHYFETNKITGSFRRLHQINLKEISHILHMTQSGTLVMSYPNKQLSSALIEQLLEMVNCPVFIFK